MRWGAALSCVAFAACGGETGVAIEIHAPPGVVAVELFVGEDHCRDELGNDACTRRGVAWEPNQPRLPGTTYTQVREVDDGQEEARHTALPVGDHFELHLQATDGAEEPHVIAFVGFDRAGQTVAVALINPGRVPTSRGERWKVHLAPTDEARAISTGRPIEGVEQPWRTTVWGRDGATRDDAARCVVVQQWLENERRWEATFIVPETDQDCDGETIECDEHYYHLNQNATGPTVCVGELPNMTSDGPCVVGATSCADGISDVRDCTLPNPHDAAISSTCVPDAVCDQCGGPYGVDACFGTAALSSVSRIECKVYADQSNGGAACGFGRPGYSTDIDLGSLGFRCPAFELRSVAAPLAPATSSELVVDQATFTLFGLPANSCSLALTFKTGAGPIGTKSWALLAIRQFYDAVGATLLIPIRIEYIGADCNMQLTEDEQCTLVGLDTDRIRSCQTAP